jgi:hypothetical protein
MRRAIVRGDRCARAANGPIADLKLAPRNDRGDCIGSPGKSDPMYVFF